MKPDRPLDDALRAAARDLQSVQPPPAVWAAVSAALDGAAQHPADQAAADRAAPPLRRIGAQVSRRRHAAWTPLAWSGAAGCVLVLVLASLLMLRAPADDGDDFIALLPADRVSAGPAWVVDAEIASDRLAALGLPYDPSRAGDRVRAQLLLHPSGDVLALRFVH